MPTNINFSKKLGITGGAGITLPTSSTPSFSNLNSFSFDGVDDYFTGVGTYSELDGQSKATFSFWIKFNFNQNSFPIWVRSASDRSMAAVVYTTGMLRLQVANSGYYATTGTGILQSDTWHHVLMCVDLSLTYSQRGKIFVDGQDETTGNNINVSSIPSSPYPLYIGTAYLGAGRTNEYGGLMDEVAIWSGTDLRNDVATIYNNGTPTDLNNNGLTAPTTWQRMGDNATWNGATWTMTDVNGGYTNRSINMVEANRTTDVPPNPFANTKSILLDGVDDYVDCGSAPFSSLSALSISAWVKPSAYGSASAESFVSTDAASPRAFYFGVYTSGRFRFSMSTNGANLNSLDTGGLTVDLNIWQHVLVTWDKVNTKFYKNGVLIKTKATSFANNQDFTTTNDLLIGARRSDAGFFDGNIDEVAVFNSELSQSDVTSIYNGGVPNDISSLSPLSWWRCGDGDTAPTLTDNGSASNNGTMQNFSTFSTDVPT